MVLGSFANDRSWTMMRRVVIRLTAPVRLEDESDIRNELSRSKAISSLMRTTKRKRALRGALQDPDRDIATKISPWFGVAAVVNMTGFVVSGIFLPWLLSEGLQGEPIVTAGNATAAVPVRVMEVATEQDVRQSVDTEYWSCESFYTGATRREAEECQVIRRDTPAVQRKLLSLDDALLKSPEYHFITANIANGSSILHLSRRVALQHLGINENSNMGIRHQLACAPANLDRLFAQEGKKYRIHLPSTHIVYNTQNRTNQNITWDMPLLTSNKRGSGRIVLGSNDPKVGLWDPTMADVILPSVPAFQTSYYADQLSPILNGFERRFLIIHRAGGRGWVSPIDDQFFAAHDELAIPEGRNTFPLYRPEIRTVFLNDREATALGCVELLDICTPRTFSEYCYSQREISALSMIRPRLLSDERLESTPWEKKDTLCNLRDYLPVLSVWIHAQVAPLGSSALTLKPGGPTWVLQVEEHFVRSMLRLRQAYRVAASRALVQYWSQRAGPEVKYEASLLYRNSDYTNINFIGFWVVLLSYIFIILLSYAMFVNHRLIPSTLRGAISRIWQKFNVIMERSRMLLENATSAMRIGYGHALSRRFSAFRGGLGTVYLGNGNQYSGPQHELPTRTASGVVDPGDEPDNPPRPARP